jgi:FMN phosphatase YigB (HAD superfamily)
LDRILEDFQVFPQECIYIGDSLAKDGMVAASRGIRFIWAHYGISLPAEYEELVNSSLKPAVEQRLEKSLPQELITAVAARYDDLMQFIV